MVKPVCPHFNVCGGCQSQDISYSTQLKLKSAKLSKLFSREVDVVANPLPFRYRNRMDFSVSSQAIGLRASGGHQVFDATQCHLVSEQMQQLFLKAKKWVVERGLEQQVSYLTVREGCGLQLIITSSNQIQEDLLSNLSTDLGISSLIAQTASSDTTTGSAYFVAGSELLDIELSSKIFSTSHNSFFQASTDAFQEALSNINEFAIGSVLDLYCGVGAITLNLDAQIVVGVESNRQAVELARINATRNDSSATFIHADASRYLIDGSFDTIIVDPPRTGLKQAALQILAANPQRIIYLSCEPTTQRRDLIQLRRNYEIIFMQGFDFFPQTDHIESLMILDRRD